MPTNILTRESTGNIPASRRVRDVEDEIHYLDPNAAPFTLLTRKASKKTAVNSKFEWIEKEEPDKYDQVNGAQTTTDTTIEVDNVARFFIGDVVENMRTLEKFRVTNNVTNLTVVRAVDGDGTTGTAMNDNDDLQIIGNSYAEGAAVGVERSVTETFPHNFTQIFRQPFGTTGTEASSENYGGRDRPRLRKESGRYHMVDIERNLLFGERQEAVSGNDGSADSPRRYTGGFFYHVTTNITDAAGTLTEPEVWTFCEKVFDATSGSDTRTLFCSSLVCSVIDLLAGARLQTVPKDQTYGIAVKQWVTSHGDLLIVKHRLLKNGPGGTGFGGHAIAVEPKGLEYRYMRDRDTKLLVDRQAPGDDKWTDEYLTECGLELKLQKTMGYIKGVTG